jgi:hypothetical protein
MQSTRNRFEVLAIVAFLVWIVLPSPSHRHRAEPVSFAQRMHSVLDSGLGGRSMGRVYHHLHASIVGPE